MPSNGTDTDIVLHEFHPPHDLRRLVCPPASVLRLDDEAVVVELVEHGLYVRHHMWADRWFTAWTTTDASGAFVEPEAFTKTMPFAFNCDIVTPFTRDGPNVSTVDLWLDVIVRADGRTYEVYDQDDFAEAIAEGWLSDRERAGAEQAVAELIDLCATDGLIDLVRSTCPFAPGERAAPYRLHDADPADFPHLLPGQRWSW